MQDDIAEYRSKQRKRVQTLDHQTRANEALKNWTELKKNLGSMVDFFEHHNLPLPLTDIYSCPNLTDCYHNLIIESHRFITDFLSEITNIFRSDEDNVLLKINNFFFYMKDIFGEETRITWINFLIKKFAYLYETLILAKSKLEILVNDISSRDIYQRTKTNQLLAILHQIKNRLLPAFLTHANHNTNDPLPEETLETILLSSDEENFRPDNLSRIINLVCQSGSINNVRFINYLYALKSHSQKNSLMPFLQHTLTPYLQQSNSQALWIAELFNFYHLVTNHSNFLLVDLNLTPDVEHHNTKSIFSLAVSNAEKASKEAKKQKSDQAKQKANLMWDHVSQLLKVASSINPHLGNVINITLKWSKWGHALQILIKSSQPIDLDTIVKFSKGVQINLIQYSLQTAKKLSLESLKHFNNKQRTKVIQDKLELVHKVIDSLLFLATTINPNAPIIPRITNPNSTSNETSLLDVAITLRKWNWVQLMLAKKQPSNLINVNKVLPTPLNRRLLELFIKDRQWHLLNTLLDNIEDPPEINFTSHGRFSDQSGVFLKVAICEANIHIFELSSSQTEFLKIVDIWQVIVKLITVSIQIKLNSNDVLFIFKILSQTNNYHIIDLILDRLTLLPLPESNNEICISEFIKIIIYAIFNTESIDEEEKIFFTNENWYAIEKLTSSQTSLLRLPQTTIETQNHSRQEAYNINLLNYFLTLSVSNNRWALIKKLSEKTSGSINLMFYCHSVKKVFLSFLIERAIEYIQSLASDDITQMGCSVNEIWEAVSSLIKKSPPLEKIVALSLLRKAIEVEAYVLAIDTIKCANLLFNDEFQLLSFLVNQALTKDSNRNSENIPLWKLIGEIYIRSNISCNLTVVPNKSLMQIVIQEKQWALLALLIKFSRQSTNLSKLKLYFNGEEINLLSFLFSGIIDNLERRNRQEAEQHNSSLLWLCVKELITRDSSFDPNMEISPEEKTCFMIALEDRQWDILSFMFQNYLDKNINLVRIFKKGEFREITFIHAALQTIGSELEDQGEINGIPKSIFLWHLVHLLLTLEPSSLINGMSKFSNEKVLIVAAAECHQWEIVNILVARNKSPIRLGEDQSTQVFYEAVTTYSKFEITSKESTNLSELLNKLISINPNYPKTFPLMALIINNIISSDYWLPIYTTLLDKLSEPVDLELLFSKLYQTNGMCDAAMDFLIREADVIFLPLFQRMEFINPNINFGRLNTLFSLFSTHVEISKTIISKCSQIPNKFGYNKGFSILVNLFESENYCLIGSLLMMGVKFSNQDLEDLFQISDTYRHKYLELKNELELLKSQCIYILSPFSRPITPSLHYFRGVCQEHSLHGLPIELKVKLLWYILAESSFNLTPKKFFDEFISKQFRNHISSTEQTALRLIPIKSLGMFFQTHGFFGMAQYPQSMRATLINMIEKNIQRAIKKMPADSEIRAEFISELYKQLPNALSNSDLINDSNVKEIISGIGQPFMQKK